MKTQDKPSSKLRRKAPSSSVPGSEEPFQLLADNMPNLAWMADADGWIYWYNRQWYDYTGTSPQDMEGWGWQAVHHPDYLQRVLTDWQAAIEKGELFEMVFPLKSADGNFRQFLTRVIPIKDANGKIAQWFGTNTDIDDQRNSVTELEQAIAGARAEQLRLHDLFMQAPAMIAVLRGPQLKFELANPLYLQVVGKTEAIIGMPVLEAMPELNGQDIVEILFNVYNTGVPFTGNEVGLKLDINNDGNLVQRYFTFVYQPVRDLAGKVNGLMTHAVDVTEHVRARQRAEESEAHFRFLAESIPQLVFTAKPDGIVDYYNPQWSEYTGVPLDKLTPESVKAFIHPDDLPDNMRSWRAAIKTGKPMQNEQRLKRMDGQYRRHISYVRAMRDEQGAITRWFGSMTDIEDISRTKARTSELERQREQLLAINQAKDEFISLASHQLRTPATGVKQFIGMLLEGYAGEISTQQQQYLERAYDSNERQLKIVNDLLRVASVDAGKVKLHLSTVDLTPLIESVIGEQAVNFKARNQQVSFRRSSQAYTVRADKDLLRMVLENLVDNAGKYTYPERSITVRLSKLAGPRVRIAVQDQGVGISKSDISKLFQKFARLDNALSAHVGGTGLGLYWVKKVIDLHGGSIAVASEPGKGSTFTLTLDC